MLRSTLISFLFLFCISYLTVAQISPKKLIKEYEKAIKPYDDWKTVEDLAFTAEAEFKVGQFNVPVRFYVKGKLMRVEMELMGAAYLAVKTDTLSWSTDFDTGELVFEDPESSDGIGFDMEKDKQFEDFLDSGYDPVEVESVMLDSIGAYHLLLKKGNDEKAFFFDQSEYHLIGRKWTGEETYFLGHERVQGFLWPKTYFVVDEGQNYEINFKEYDFQNEIDDELFRFTPEQEEAYRKFLAAPPEESANVVQQHYDEGESLREDGSYAEAINAYTKSLDINPNQYLVLNGRGLAKTFSGDHYGAITDFTRAIELKGADTGVLFNNLGLAKYRLGDYDGAKTDYTKALSLDTTNANFYSNYGILMFQYEDYAAVVEYLSKAVAINSDYTLGYYYRAIANAELENYEDALADYAYVEKEGVELGEFFNYKGVSLYVLEQYDSAKVAFSRAAELEPNEVQYWKNLADTHDELEEYHEAIAVYDQLAATDSTLYDVYAERALSYYSLSLNVAAKRDIDKAIALSPESAIYYDYRAYIKEDLGDYSGAVEDFTMSLNLEQDPNIYYRRGLAKINLNNKNEACIDFKKGAELGSDEAKEAMGEHCKLK